jgi:hypothetical protein
MQADFDHGMPLQTRSGTQSCAAIHFRCNGNQNEPAKPEETSMKPKRLSLLPAIHISKTHRHRLLTGDVDV